MKKLLTLLFFASVIYAQDVPPSVKNAIGDSLNNVWERHVKDSTLQVVSDSSKLTSNNKWTGENEFSNWLGIPTYPPSGSPSKFQEGGLYYVDGSTDVGLKFQYTDAVPNNITTLIPDTAKVRQMIQSAGYTYPSNVSDSIEADERIFSITIDNPTSSENVTLFWNGKDYATNGLKIKSVRAVIQTNGGNDDSIKVNISWGNLRTIENASLFNGDKWVSSTTGQDMTSNVYASTIDYDSWIWFKTSDKVGTVNSVTLSVTYTKD